MAEKVLEPTQSGLFSVRIGNKYLHSRFDPLQEAEKFLSQRTLDQAICCILLCPALGFLVTVLRQKFPKMRILCIHPDSWYVDNKSHQDSANVLYWFPEHSLSLDHFLAKTLTECEATMTELVIWPPATTSYSDFCDEKISVIQGFLKISHANWITQGYFGKKWLKNSFNNFLASSSNSKIFDLDRPVFLAASGPGLEAVLPIIKQYRNKIYIWALPSSIRALSAIGLQPDVIVTSDAGYWAGRHLSFIPKSWLKTRQTYIYSPLRANLHPLIDNLGSVVFHSSTEFIDTIIQSQLEGIFDKVIPDCGTVAATAIELLIAYGFKKLFIAGLDFANYDMQSHVRPHSFLEQTFLCANRLLPVYSQLFEGIGEAIAGNSNISWNFNSSLSIYRDWFEKRCFQTQIDIHNYNPSGQNKNMPAATLTEFQKLFEQLPSENSEQFQDYEHPSLKVSESFKFDFLLDLVSSFQKIIDSPSEATNMIFHNLANHVTPFIYRDWIRACAIGLDKDKASFFKIIVAECNIFLSELNSMLKRNFGTHRI